MCKLYCCEVFFGLKIQGEEVCSCLPLVFILRHEWCGIMRYPPKKVHVLCPRVFPEITLEDIEVPFLNFVYLSSITKFRASLNFSMIGSFIQKLWPF